MESTSHIIYDESTKRRNMHLAALLPVTRPERDLFLPLESRVFYVLGSLIAVQHFNARSNAIISDLDEKLKGCDMQLSIEYRDTEYSKIKGAQHIQAILSQFPTNTLDKPFPAAIVGSGRSDVSETVQTLSQILQIPQVSPHSSASELDDKGRYPYFARTTPSSGADGKAAVDYFRWRGITHFSVIFIQDSLGNSYNEDIRREVQDFGMTVESVPYNPKAGEEDIRIALRRLKESQYKYVFAVIEPTTWKEFVRIAISEKMINTPDIFWLWHSGMVGLVPEELDRTTEYDIARAIDGSGILLKNFPPNPTLDELLMEYESNLEKQQSFISLWSEPEKFDGWDFRYPGPNYPQYINFDAVIALGLAACQIDNEYFTGAELYKSLLTTEFEGASSYVSFYNDTGTRRSVPFQVDNVLMVEKDISTLGFVQVPTALISGVGEVTEIAEFKYWDDSLTVPPFLPPLNANENLIPASSIAAGLAFCGLAVLVSFVCAIWTCARSDRQVVKVSQPFFLYQLCLGCIIMASSIIPMSFQEPMSKSTLDIGCVLMPWLLFCGYAIAFAALFSKMWRINKIFAGGRRMRRVTISARDASWPLAILLTCNATLLTIWKVVSPLGWSRDPASETTIDRFGRAQDTYGRCKGDDNITIVMISLLAIINGLGLVLTNIQAWKTRGLPTAFNEAFYLFVSNAALLEVLILGIPILFLASDSPSSSFIVKSLVITVLCLCILLPTFVPKFLQRNTIQNRPGGRGSVTRSSNGRNCSTFNIRNSISMDFLETPNDSNGKDQIQDDDSKMRIIRSNDYYLQRGLPIPDRESSIPGSSMFSY